MEGHKYPSPFHGIPAAAVETIVQTSRALEPQSHVQNGRRYILDVVQQPKRARMCGFGDKDRRPITPPPCIRLKIIDSITNKEVDCNEIEHSMFVLNVDLWSEDALKEVNLVRHTTTTPSISSTTPASYTQVEAGLTIPAYSNILPSHQHRDPYGAPVPVPVPAYPNMPPSQQRDPYASSAYGTVAAHPFNQPQQFSSSTYIPSPNGYGPPQQYFTPAVSDFRPELHNVVQLAQQQPGSHMAYSAPRMYEGVDLSHRVSVGGTTPQGMFTRNLIGSLSASAFRLTDPQDKIGIWFVLQDLSVRTEGTFRLRFSFVNVGQPGNAVNGTSPGQSSSAVNTGKAPVLASCYSDIFQVYSAKKFPGVCESTPLSKCFATQGIKIPIRKEGAGNRGGGGDNDDFE